MANADSTLQGQVAVVTGGGRGIGAGIARKLAGLGANVVIAGRNRQHLEDTAGEIRRAGQKCDSVICDVTLLPDLERLARHIERTGPH